MALLVILYIVDFKKGCLGMISKAALNLVSNQITFSEYSY